MSTLKNKTINHIIDVEGGYINDPLDSGGETNWGITLKVAREYGYEGKMRDLPRSLAFKIYSDKYWDSLRLSDIEKLAPSVAQELADTGVNMGVGRAAEFLQRSLNIYNNREKYYPDIKVDRDIGPASLRALEAFLSHRGKEGEMILYRTLNALQGAFYVELVERREKDEKYVYGWYLNRVD